MAREWADLSPEEKREERFKRWLSPADVKFSSPEAEKAYKERVSRFVKAFQLKEPDRVPCILPTGLYAATYAGTNLQTAMYDYDEMRRAWLKLLHDFDGDSYAAPVLVPPGRVMDVVDFKSYTWPGHGLSTSALSYQAVEGEWMKADEYDALIKDPTDFWLRTLLPRFFGVFEAFGSLPRLTSLDEILAITNLVPFGLPQVQAGLKALLEAGAESLKWMSVVGEVIGQALAAGFPSIFGGIAKAPFDTLGDTLRGTQGIMKDMFQRPDKIHEAMARIAPLTVETAINSANSSGTPVIFMPLHKGADGFMSGKQYETFYWPAFKKVIMALVDEGILPLLFAEGGYNQRLEIISELPRGSVAWYFDQTDMARAKEILGDTACIAGNVPASLLMTGTPQEVKECCRKLIEVAGKGGGYILTGGAHINEGNHDNLRAIMEAAREYGKYK